MYGNSLNEVENIVSNGEIARHEHSLLLQQCFRNSNAAEASKGVCVLVRVKSLPLVL